MNDEDPQDDADDEQACNRQMEWIKEIIDGKRLDLQEMSRADFVCVLIDLTLYQHGELVNKAFENLLRHFSQRHELIETLKNVQMLEYSDAIEVLKNVQDQLTQLRNESDASENWMGVDDKGASDTSDRVGSILDYLTSLCYVSQGLPNGGEKGMTIAELANDTSSRVNSEEPELEDFRDSTPKKTQMNTIRESFIDEITLDEDQETPFLQEHEIPNVENQRLLRNLKAYEIVLSLIKFKVPSSKLVSSQHKSILAKCYKFLIRFVRLCEPNQKIISEYLNC